MTAKKRTSVALAKACVKSEAELPDIGDVGLIDACVESDADVPEVGESSRCTIP